MLATFRGQANQLHSPRSSSPLITMTSIDDLHEDDANVLDEILGSHSANPVTPGSINGSTPRNGGSSAKKSPRSANKPSPARAPFKSPSTDGQRRVPTTQEKLRARQMEDDRKARLIAGAFKALEYNPKTPSPPKIIIASKRKETVVDPFDLRTAARSESAKARLRQQRDEEVKLRSQTEPRHRFRARAVPRTTFEYEPISKFQLSSSSMKRIEKLKELSKKFGDAEEKDKEERPQFYRPPPESTYKSPTPVSKREEEAFQRSTSMKRKKLELQLEEEKKREREISPRKARPAPPTTYSPRHILAEKEQQAMTEAQIARGKKREEMKKQEELKKLEEEGSARKARPPPPTTYSPRHILAEKEAKAIRDAALAREMKLEEQRRLEEEKRREEEAIHKARPVPATTYSPRHISAEKEDKAIRDAALARELRLDEQRKLEEQKKREDEASHKARPVPPTTYKSNPISPEKEQKALSDAVLVREQKLEKIHQVEEKKLAEEEQKYKARPLPKTTYEPKTISPKDSNSVHKAEEAGQKRRGRPESGARFSFRARPVPKAVYKPVSVKEVRPTLSPKKPVIILEVPPVEEKFKFQALPVPKSTFVSPKSPKVHVKREEPDKKSTPPKATGEEEAKVNAPGFHARAVPKSLYKPKLVTPKKPIKREAPRMPVSGTRDRAVPVGKAREAKFHARPLPKTTYKPAVVKRPEPKQDEPKKDVPPTSAEAKDIEDENKSEFHALPVPETTCKPEVLSPRAADDTTAPENKEEVSPRQVDQPEEPTEQPKQVDQPEEPTEQHAQRNAGSVKSGPTFRARPVPKTTYKPAPVKKDVSVSRKVGPEISEPGSSKARSTSSFRARPVPKSTYTAKTTDFRPISAPKKFPSTGTVEDRSASFRTRLAARGKATASKSSTTPDESVPIQDPTQEVPSTTTTTTTQEESVSFQQVPSSSPPTKQGTPKYSSRAFVDVSHSQGGHIDEFSKIAAAILNDEDSPEITFERDEDENAEDDNELAAILGGMGAWTATAENDDEIDVELDAILHH